MSYKSVIPQTSQAITNTVPAEPNDDEQSEVNSPFALSKLRPKEISKRDRQEEEMYADRLSIQLKKKMSFKSVSDKTDEFESQLSRGGTIQLKIQEMIESRQNEISSGMFIRKAHAGSFRSNSEGRNDPTIKRTQTIAFKSSKTLAVGKTHHEVIEEIDDDDLQTDFDEDEYDDEEDQSPK